MFFVGINASFHELAVGVPLEEIVNGISGLVVSSDIVRQLLMGGLSTGSKLFDLAATDLTEFRFGGVGPVAFRRDGTAVQFFPKDRTFREDRSTFILGDLATGRVLAEFRITEQPEPYARSDNILPKMAITSDASHVAAGLDLENDAGVFAVWEASSGKLIGKFPHRATSLALSPDGALVAAGNQHGKILVWSLAKGDQIAAFKGGHVTIRCLKFTRDMSRKAADSGESMHWLLAAGDSGGMVTLSDLDEQTVREKYRGSNFDVYCLDFSPDGTLLATGGRGSIRLWDVANARVVLNIPGPDLVTGLAFSPDGKHLAASTEKGFWPAHVSVWELEYGRGIQTLYALANQISKVRFSADSRFIAVLTHSWEIAVWELATGSLKGLFPAPEGSLQADNAAIALSPDGTQLAFAAGTTAKLWEVTSGRELRSWKIPDGYANQLTFVQTNRLFYFQAETLSGTVNPFATNPVKDPLVCRIRELMGPEPTREIPPIYDLNWYLYSAAFTAGGKCVVAEGLNVTGNGEARKRQRMIKVFDTFSGEERLSIPSTSSMSSLMFIHDSWGPILLVKTNNDSPVIWFDVLSKSALRTMNSIPLAVGPVGKKWVMPGSDSAPDRGCSVFLEGRSRPVISLGIDSESPYFPQFDATGDLLAWGNADGTVTVCSLPEIRSRLAPLHLGW